MPVNSGVHITELGPEVDDIARLEIPLPATVDAGVVEAEVIHIDRFGNVITNLDRTSWEELTGSHDDTGAEVVCGSVTLAPISKTYGDVPSGAALALWGSSGLLEISVNQGDAAEKTGAKLGDKVKIRVGER